MVNMDRIRREIAFQDTILRGQIIEFIDWLAVHGYALDVTPQTKTKLADRFVKDRKTHISDILNEAKPQ
jgi:hypothetical protein